MALKLKRKINWCIHFYVSYFILKISISLSNLFSYLSYVSKYLFLYLTPAHISWYIKLLLYLSHSYIYLYPVNTYLISVHVYHQTPTPILQYHISMIFISSLCISIHLIPVHIYPSHPCAYLSMYTSSLNLSI